MNEIIAISGSLILGSSIMWVIQNLRLKNQMKNNLIELDNKMSLRLSNVQNDLDISYNNELEIENDKTEAEDDSLTGRRHNLSQRRRNLNRKRDGIHSKEQRLDKAFRKNNNRKRDVQRKQRHNRKRRGELHDIYNQQKEQLIEKLNIDAEEFTKEILDKLEKEVHHERQLWIQHCIEDVEHLNDQLAAELVDTLVCRMQLKPTVKPQENKLTIPNKEYLKKAFEEGSEKITQLQDLCQVELVFNEERNEVRVSAYDGVAREICLRLLNRLFQKWPEDKEGWLEDTVKQITRRLEREMTRCCGDLLRRLRIENVNVEVVRVQGRLRFRTSYGQNVLDHVLESAYIGGMMAAELGMEEKLGRRSSFLHDVGKAIDVTQEGSHPELGGEFLMNIEELPEVTHAAAKHHGSYNPLHLFTAIAKSADAMSGGRPGARRETIDNYVERVESLENIAKRAKGVMSVSITQAGRDIQINVDPKKISDDKLQEISDTVAADIQKELTYPGEIKVSAVREIWTKQVAH